MKKYRVGESSELTSIQSLRNFMWKIHRITINPNISDEALEKLGVTVINYEEPGQTLEYTRARKMAELAENFTRMRNEPGVYVNSSLGFFADSNVTALTDVEGLIHILNTKPEGATVLFRDYYNEYHPLDLQMLHILAAEISGLAAIFYQKKWEKQAQLQAATTIDELELVDLNFEENYPLE